MKPETYLDKNRGPYPFCPGCSHGKILDAVDKALLSVAPSLSDVVIVSDIGCTGLSDQWFATHAFHGLHGRSVVYGEALSLCCPDLFVIVFIGDGAAGVGLHHLVSAARRNINMTVIMFNNFNFGMTGGEHSITSPFGSLTSSSPYGNIEIPARVAETLELNGAPFTARSSSFDIEIEEIIEQALLFKGFAFVEVLEICTAYYGPHNRLRKSGIRKMLESEILPKVFKQKEGRTEFKDLYKEKEIEGYTPDRFNSKIEVKFNNSLDNDILLCISGSAGQTIQSTAALFAVSAIMAGIHVIQKDDYPVTIKTGYSLSTLRLSKTPSEYSGSGVPDLMFVLSKEGLDKAGSLIEKMPEGTTIIIAPDLPEIQTAASVMRVDFEKLSKKTAKSDRPLILLSSWLKRSRIFKSEALTNAVRTCYDGDRAIKLTELVEISSSDIFEIQ